MVAVTAMMITPNGIQIQGTIYGGVGEPKIGYTGVCSSDMLSRVGILGFL
jgi:hypothetical protein